MKKVLGFLAIAGVVIVIYSQYKQAQKESKKVNVKN